MLTLVPESPPYPKNTVSLSVEGRFTAVNRLTGVNSPYKSYHFAFGIFAAACLSEA